MSVCGDRTLTSPAFRLLRIDAPHVRLLHWRGPTPVGPDFDEKLFGFHARRHGDFLFDVLEISKREGYLTPLATRECREIRTPGLAIDFTVHRKDDHAAHHGIRLHGLDQRDEDAELVCSGRGHDTRLLYFYFGRVRILRDDPPEKGQFLVGPGDLGLQIADRALHLLTFPGLSYGGRLQLRHLGAQLGNRGFQIGDLLTVPGTMLEA